ncbi:MAG TPA: hypothetical protein VFY25_00190 [Anaerolineales bacterium]|nr:hypothetical protein [Anaerolineales bacterium]
MRLNCYASRGVAEQAANYVTGLPQNTPPVTLPLPFPYESTGVETAGWEQSEP